MRRTIALLSLLALVACSSGEPKGAGPPQPSERKALNDAAAMLRDPRAQTTATAQTDTPKQTDKGQRP